MRGCPQCGERSDDRSSFCWACGAPLRPVQAPREARKTVTTLFCDVVGSTTIGESQDPERLHWLMTRFFGEMAAIVERHGGTVGKFMGDAVMAVFGTPVVHEDDALRAVRAAVEMREALVGLNDELEQAVGVRFAVRIGINTGAVMVGDPSRSDTLVTGDAVNTAKRLETSAGPGEIVIGGETHRLVRAAVVADELAPVTAKGKAQPVRAYRVQEVVPGVGMRVKRFGSRFVGRERELALVGDTLLRTIRQRSCHLLTVLGQPGVGKSRLVAEAIGGAAPEATVLRGSCLPYGEGITFWPVIEIVRDAVHAEESDGTEDVRGALAALLAGEENATLVAEGVAQLTGTPGGRSAEELFWAVRTLLETIARRGPLVVVFDDIHWAEPMLLDLIEHIAERSRDAPILVVCIARPELSEVRSSWSERSRNATSMLLEPLTVPESTRLIGELLGSVALPDEVRTRIHEAAEGYPLFVEEMVSMLVEDGLLRRENGGWAAAVDAPHLRIPETINLLLASRIDRLPDQERQVLEWASVEGRVFHVSAVRHLSSAPAVAHLDRALAALVDKELVQPERPQVAGESAFRFRHILIRDAAYESLPKQSRADLHERFANWLETSTADDGQFAGYHLERAYRYRSELHRVQEPERELAGRAGRKLESAGVRARRRGDMPAAAKFLTRAVGLLREDEGAPADTLMELGSALVEIGDLNGGLAVFDEAAHVATASGDVRLANRAALDRSFVRVLQDPAYDADRLRGVAEEAIPAFEAVGDDLGLATALMRVAEAHWFRCHFAAMEEVLEQALVHASRADDQTKVVQILGLLSWAVVVGPRSVDEAIPRCHEILAHARAQPRLEAWTESVLAMLEAMRGHAQEARALYRSSQAALADLGLKSLLASAQMCSGMAELILRDPAAAEREFSRGYAALEEIGETAQLSTMAAYLARALIAQERYDDAERYAVVSEGAASEDDLASQVLSRAARARIEAHRGELERAERLARQAVELARQSDVLNLPADVLMDLAHVVRAARPGEADVILAEAFAIYQAKGNKVSAAEARALRRKWVTATHA